jgi:hypothetical protein
MRSSVVRTVYIWTLAPVMVGWLWMLADFAWWLFGL